MEKDNQTFKLLVIVAAIFALLFVAYTLTKNSKRDGDKQAVAQQAIVEKINVDFAKDPEKFPSDIPMEAGAKLTQNYNATTPTGAFQATKVFLTTKTLAENLTIYTNYFQQNGWKITASLDQPTYKMVTGAKDKQSIQVSIDENKMTKDRTVSINFTESK